jgi:hypothetical protein
VLSLLTTALVEQEAGWDPEQAVLSFLTAAQTGGWVEPRAGLHLRAKRETLSEL